MNKDTNLIFYCSSSILQQKYRAVGGEDKNENNNHQLSNIK